MSLSDQPRLGVCYYPEHWPEKQWAEDARAMVDLGLSLVRIGEFAWSEIEPDPGRYEWDWLTRAVETLSHAGLKIILGTPTATPPKWLVDAYPDILARDRDGRARRFGSRRHYCFSSERYRIETARIVEAMAARFGAHDTVVAWQTDNEYGCHETIRSWSAGAEAAFRVWLEDRYQSIETLNAAWGGAFWSQRYRSFREVDLPNLTVTEPNPSHVMDFYRFSSNQALSYNRLQADILRRLSPDREIIHNFMGFFHEFDHFAMGADIDIASWDSYPLGFLDIGPYDDDDRQRYLRNGHPDFAAFHHDLYRACSRASAVMEQQPGPVNWARHNPAPAPGMVRLWTEEAFAHGAAFVSYFRWRQAPFAQEQMHAGLLRRDGAPAPGHEEARDAANALPGGAAKTNAPVALIFDYEAQWLFEIQPQGAAWDYVKIVLEWYGALRRLGFDIDIAPPGRKLSEYKLVVAPSLPFVSEAAMAALAAADCEIILGPRSGSKTASVQVPQTLAPGALQSLIDLKVTHSESFPPTHRESVDFANQQVTCGVWLDHVETKLTPEAATRDGAGVLFRSGSVSLLTSVPDQDFLMAVFEAASARAALEVTKLPRDVRTRRRGSVRHAFNYGPEPVAIDGAAHPIPPAGTARLES